MPRQSAGRRLLVLVLLSAAWTAAARGEGGAGLEAQLRVEERLLADDLRAYGEARDQERQALSELEEVAARLDAAVSGLTPRLEDLEQIEIERAVAQAAAEVIGRRVADLRLRLLERVRRTAALRQELFQRAGLAAEADPISGRWRVEIGSPRQEGTFDLRLLGSVVEGTFAFEAGRTGSLRGTYVAGRLRLERIDAQRGLDGTFEGSVDPATGVARGFWSPALLSDGGPGGAGWSAVRVREEEPQAAEEPEPAAQPRGGSR
jgi:hypothetical protein